MDLGFLKALKKEKNLFRLNWCSNMQMKWMSKMVVFVKCQFLVTLIGKLYHFTFIDPIKIHEKCKVLSKL